MTDPVDHIGCALHWMHTTPAGAGAVADQWFHAPIGVSQLSTPFRRVAGMDTGEPPATEITGTKHANDI